MERGIDWISLSALCSASLTRYESGVSLRSCQGGMEELMLIAKQFAEGSAIKRSRLSRRPDHVRTSISRATKEVQHRES